MNQYSCAEFNPVIDIPNLYVNGERDEAFRLYSEQMTSGTLNKCERTRLSHRMLDLGAEPLSETDPDPTRYVRTLRVCAHAQHLGNTAFVATKYLVALRYYAIVRNCNPTDWRAHINMSAVNLRRNAPAQTFRDADRAFRTGLIYGATAQQLSLARTLASTALRQLGQSPDSWSEAADRQQRVWSPHPCPPCAVLAEVQQQVRQPSYAVEMELAFMFVRWWRKYDQAEAHFSAAIALQPDWAAAYVGRSWCFLRMGEWASGLVAAEWAIESSDTSSGQHAWAHWMLAMCHFGAQSYGPAGQAFKAAADLHPGMELFRRSVRSLLDGRDAMVFEEMRMQEICHTDSWPRVGCSNWDGKDDAADAGI